MYSDRYPKNIYVNLKKKSRFVVSLITTFIDQTLITCFKMASFLLY